MSQCCIFAWAKYCLCDKRLKNIAMLKISGSQPFFANVPPYRKTKIRVPPMSSLPVCFVNLNVTYDWTISGVPFDISRIPQVRSRYFKWFRYSVATQSNTVAFGGVLLYFLWYSWLIHFRFKGGISIFVCTPLIFSL